MNNFEPGDEVTVKGTVLRTRGGRVELQTPDGQLLRIPVAHVQGATAEKAVKEAPENKAVVAAPESKSVTQAPENKSGGARRDVEPRTASGRNGGGRRGA